MTLYFPKLYSKYITLIVIIHCLSKYINTLVLNSSDISDSINFPVVFINSLFIYIIQSVNDDFPTPLSPNTLIFSLK